MGFTGVNSPGSHDFNFSQLVFIDGQSQMMNIFGTIDIGFDTHTVHLLHADPLTFTFDTFTVDVTDVARVDARKLRNRFWRVLRTA